MLDLLFIEVQYDGLVALLHTQRQTTLHRELPVNAGKHYGGEHRPATVSAYGEKVVSCR
jgi:hypothetical protein